MNQFELEIQANKLAQEIENSNGDLSIAYLCIETTKEEIEKSFPIEALIHDSNERGIGMALKNMKSGKSFWQVYSLSIRDKICKPNEKLHDLVKAGLASSAGAIATALSSMLVFPPVAVGMIVPIAAILATTGIDAFCEWTKKEDNEA